MKQPQQLACKITVVVIKKHIITSENGIEKQELKRLKKQKGSFGLGFQLASISGLSVKKEFGRFGINVIGWHQNSENYVNEQVNIRLFWQLKEKLFQHEVITLSFLRCSLKLYLMTLRGYDGRSF